MIHEDDKMKNCPMCDEEMLYWQLQNHIVIYHANIEKWNLTAGNADVNVCSNCAQCIIQANSLIQIDWKEWSGQDDGTDVWYHLWQPFKQKLEPFRCSPCWERNH